jgi:hypothetical protein
MYDAHIIVCKGYINLNGRNVSPDEQKTLCLEAARRLGCHLDRVKILIDEDPVNASWDERRVLRELKKDIESGFCRRLIIYDVLGFAKPEVFDELITLLKVKRIELHVARMIEMERGLQLQLKDLGKTMKVRYSTEVSLGQRGTPKIIRGVLPEWCVDKRGREKEVAFAVAKWAKEYHVARKCFVAVRAMKSDNGSVQWFCPDIDVLVVTETQVISHEVKLLRGKKTGLPKLVRINLKTLKAGVLEEYMTRRFIDEAVYDGLGKALFNSLKSDRSYLVLPSPGISDELMYLIKKLPIGLITFESEDPEKFNAENLSFSIIKEAPLQRKSQLRDYIFEHAILNQLVFSKSL